MMLILRAGTQAVQAGLAAAILCAILDVDGAEEEALNGVINTLVDIKKDDSLVLPGFGWSRERG